MEALFCIQGCTCAQAADLPPMARKSSSTNFANLVRLQHECPMQTALQMVGGRWKVLILWYVHLGPNRYSQLLNVIPGISRKMLTTQLQELVADGLLQRHQGPGKLPQVWYTWTAATEALLPVLRALNEWGRLQQTLQVASPAVA